MTGPLFPLLNLKVMLPTTFEIQMNLIITRVENRTEHENDSSNNFQDQNDSDTGNDSVGGSVIV